MPRKYTTIQVTFAMRRRLQNLKFDARATSYEQMFETLFDFKKIKFTMVRGSSQIKILGLQLPKKLAAGWRVKSVDWDNFMKEKGLVDEEEDE